MEILLKKEDLILYKTSNLILGASKHEKEKINNELVKLNVNIIDKNFSFSTSHVKTELENYNVSIESFNVLNKIVNKSIEDLNISERYFLKIILKMPIRNGLLVIDDLLTYLDKEKRNVIFDYARKNNILIIAYSETIEDDYFFDGYMIVFMNDKVAISGLTKAVLNEDKLLKRLGYRLPFSIDLSNQLKLYGMLANTCYSIGELEGELWP